MIPIRNSRQRCSIERYDNNVFFSLVCYRNNLFTSNDPEKIIEFYNGFEDRDQLIQWMKERPKGASYIHEVNGDKDIVVVIPTADFGGKYAKTCREKLFKGLHMIFVESGENPDSYFNYAHNCNVGIKKAIEYNPKWVVVSNDDMNKIDEVKKLIERLKEVSPKDYDILFPNTGVYHTLSLYIGKKRTIYNLYKLITDRFLYVSYKRFKIDFFYAFHNWKSKVVFKKIYNSNFICTVALGIFSSKYLERNGKSFFDEIYINEHEDLDISFRLHLIKAKCKQINYSIDALRGSTLTNGRPRELRAITGRTYFNWKYSKLFQYMIESGKNYGKIRINPYNDKLIEIAWNSKQGDGKNEIH